MSLKTRGTALKTGGGEVHLQRRNRKADGPSETKCHRGWFESTMTAVPAADAALNEGHWGKTPERQPNNVILRQSNHQFNFFIVTDAVICPYESACIATLTSIIQMIPHTRFSPDGSGATQSDAQRADRIVCLTVSRWIQRNAE